MIQITFSHNLSLPGLTGNDPGLFYSYLSSISANRESTVDWERDLEDKVVQVVICSYTDRIGAPSTTNAVTAGENHGKLQNTGHEAVGVHFVLLLVD